MRYDFDTVIERRGTYAMKWALAELAHLAAAFGMDSSTLNEETIPMMTADMDLQSPQPVIDAMHRVADHMMYGYSMHVTDPRFTTAANEPLFGIWEGELIVPVTELGIGLTMEGMTARMAYRVIFNTVPTMVLPSCPGNALKIDLASRLGLGSEDVIWARGLPGIHAPEKSGKLIAETILSRLKEESP